MTDKNLKRVYEGDIAVVKHRTQGSGANTKWKDFNCLVIFHRHGFVIDWPKNYGRYRFRSGNDFENSEVIGNIFENPELLNT